MRSKATTIRLSNSTKKWVEEQAELDRRTLFGQARYVLDLVLEDWEWVLGREQERQKEMWSIAVKTTADEEIDIDTSEDNTLSVKIPLSTFNPIAKLALSSHRSANDQMAYLIEIAKQDWPELQERRLRRATEKKTKERDEVTPVAIRTSASERLARALPTT